LICSTGFAVLSPNEKVNPYYLYKYLTQKNVIEYLQGVAETSTSTYPSIKPSDIASLEINLPPLLEQKAIANILSSLDDKIELNNKINKNLEELAQTIYKRWFVDFEFPNEDGEPYKSSGGEMIEGELGLIPKGWEDKKLSDVIKISYGKNFPTKNLHDKGYPVFGGNGIIGYAKKYLYKEPKVLVSCRGAASGGVLVSLEKSFVTNNSLVLEDNEDMTFEYLKEFSLNRKFNDFVSGSAQPQVTITSINNCKILMPSINILLQYSNFLKPLNVKIEKYYYENLKLVEIRDILLPKLMSGEIEVPYE